MSLVVNDTHNPAIDSLVQSNKYNLKWVFCSEITDITSSQVDNIYYAIRKQTRSDGRVYEDKIMMLLLGNNETCTPSLVSEFARIHSLPTHKYNNDDNNFRRYSYWLYYRNVQIKGFTEHDNNYYMVADRRFYHYYSLYGFCTACGILRCSPVWCICGNEELSDGWTSNKSNSISLLRNLNYKQTQQIMPIWNGFHSIVLMLRDMKYAYLLLKRLN